MENASKALIIAGAILLAILLISMGMLVLNKATGILDNDQLDEAAVSTFNQKFTKYEGEKVKGSSVRSLISEISAYNGSDEAADNKQFIDVVSGSGDKAPSTTGNPPTLKDTGAVVNTKYYKVEITERANKGKVSQITITAL